MPITSDQIPVAPEAEQAVLGGILLQGKLPDCPIEKNLFFYQSNREILGVILDIAADDETIDPINVIQRLREKGQLEAIGVPYISSLYGDLAIRSRVESNLELLREVFAKREIHRAATYASEAALNGHGSQEIARGMLNALDRVTTKGKKKWPEPLPLPEGRARAPKLDPDILPAAIRPWLEDIANRLQVPLDFAAIPALVSLATVIGSKVRIRPKQKDDWTVVPNLWGAIIGDPGLLKSPSIEQATKPLRRLIMAAEERHRAQMEQFMAEADALEQRKAEIKKQIKAHLKLAETLPGLRLSLQDPELGEERRAIIQANIRTAEASDSAIQALRAEINEALEPPKEKRYLVNDATVEKLGELLAENRNGLLMFRDELTGWLKTLDRENNANERAFYLEAWNGGQPYTYDRIGRGTTKIPNTTMSVIGGIQPGPLAAYLEAANENGAGADGLIQRFQLAVWPDGAGEYQHVDEWPDKDAKSAAFDVFKCLDAIGHIDPRLPHSDDDGYAFLRFDDDAQKLFDGWYTDLQNRIRSSTLDPAFVSHLAKFGSLFASLALIFHLCETACDQYIADVSLDAAAKAFQWCDYLEGHAMKIYNLQVAEAGESIKRLAEKIKDGKIESPFQVRHIQQKHWAGLSRADEIWRALDILCDLHWIERIEAEGLVRGSKPKVKYSINPKLVE